MRSSNDSSNSVSLSSYQPLSANLSMSLPILTWLPLVPPFSVIASNNSLFCRLSSSKDEARKYWSHFVGVVSGAHNKKDAQVHRRPRCSVFHPSDHYYPHSGPRRNPDSERDDI